MFLNELKKFSRENWGVYLLLVIALSIVYITGKGNLIEIIILFMLNFLGNLFIMVAMGNYQSKNNKIGSIYHLSATLTFTIISIYGVIFLSQYQYIFWQTTYLIAAIKAITYYKYNYNIKVFNTYVVGGINIILLGLFVTLFPFSLFGTIQALGFSFVTIGLVSIHDTFRYYISLIGILLITSGSVIGVWLSYINNNIDGIALGYFLLTLSVLIYYMKLLPKYLKK